MKDITLKITGKQIFDGQEEEQMEFVTDGKFYLRNGAAYVVYDESEISGLAGCKTTLKLKDGTVKMRRVGGGGFGTELYFEKGKRFSNTYNTPYGEMEIEVLTSKVNTDIDFENGCGNISIDYNVSMEGVAEGKNQICIDIS